MKVSSLLGALTFALATVFLVVQTIEAYGVAKETAAKVMDGYRNMLAGKI